MSTITFGTSGYRGIIGHTFTTHHLIAICQAIIGYFKSQNISKPKVLFGYDSRTGNSPNLEENSYTFAVASELTSNKVHVDFCDNFTATPVISWAVQHYNYDLGINLTASHNPPNYNGIKISDSDGAPAPIELTQYIQSEATKIINNASKFKLSKLSKSYFTPVNYSAQFIDHTQHLIKDTFKLNLYDFSNHYIIDTKCGAGIDIWKQLTASAIGKFTWLNDHFSPDFNFKLPDPTSQETLSELSQLCTQTNSVAFSNDPDADRHVMVDENGNKVSPEKLAAIIINYCIKEDILIDSISTTLANSVLVKKICKKYNIQCHETKIGFKYFSSYLKDASKNNKLSIGVESSGGFSISYHTFDKCGFIPILIILGIMKKNHQTLAELSHEIDAIFHPFIFIEDAIKITSSNSNTSNLLHANQDRIIAAVKDSIEKVSTTDGLKITFKNDGWVLCRASGTEPLIRIYAESNDPDAAKGYIATLKNIFN